MNNEWQIKTSIELNLSFDFVILKHYDRTIDIKILGLLRDVKFHSNYFDWFMEDLLFLLEQNRYQKRWDYGLINIYGLENLNLKEKELEELINNFKLITNFDLIAKK